MATIKTSSRVLDTWLKELLAVQPPIPAEQRESLLRTITDSRRSLGEIAEKLYECPSATLAVLRAANRSNNSLSEPAMGLEQALGRLGLEQTEDLLRTMQDKSTDKFPHGLAQLQLISQHASQQASGLFASRLARLWQEIRCNSLLFLSPLWLLVCARPELFEAWEQRILIKGEPSGKVEKELLGLPLLEICLALSEKLKLPAWIVQGYQLLLNDRRMLVKAVHIARDHEHPLHQQQQLDEDTALRRWLTRTENSALLANCIAIAAHHDWNGEHCRRWQRLTGLCLKVPVDDLRQVIHQQAVNSARQHARPALWHPAEALLWPWECQRWLPLKAPEAAPVKSDNLAQWRQLCADLLREPSAFANVLQITGTALNALRLCGLSRVMLLLADRQHTRLITQQCTGLPVETARLSLDPAQSQLLRHLLSKPGQLHLTPANMAQYSAMLPGSLKTAFPSTHMLFRSIASNQRVVMLLIADQDGNEISPSCLQGFGKTVQCIERAMHTFSNRPR